MKPSLILLLFLFSALVSGFLLYFIFYVHRLNKTLQRFQEGDTDAALPSSSLPVLSSLSSRQAILTETIRDLQNMEKLQQGMLALEKKERTQLVEEKTLAQQLEHQLEETRQANQRIFILNRDLEEINTSLNEAINRLSALHQISRMLGMEHDKKQIFRMALSLPAELLQAEIGHLFLFDKGTGEMNLEYSLGLPAAQTLSRRNTRETSPLAGWVAANKKPLLIPDFRLQDTFSPNCEMGYERKTSLTVPIMIRDELIGIISLVNRKNGQPFSDNEKTLLATIASETAMAINNALLLEKIQKNYFSTIESLIMVVESKDMYTRGHSERVTRYSLLIAEQMGLSLDQMEIVQRAAILHDIGKITVELSILNKPTALEDSEYDQIKLHPLIGYRILEPLDFDERIKLSVLQHHERPDGKGYPKGLREEEILLEAKILTVADTFDAMTSARPYRAAINIEDSLREMENNAGTQLDSEIVKILCKIIRSTTSYGTGLMVG
ncbi:MAG: HD domain-containing protein [Proteobacteria bacterium]|nr:HD domain-containing protein [Pseudomonadota bacterium]